MTTETAGAEVKPRDKDCNFFSVRSEEKREINLWLQIALKGGDCARAGKVY